MSSVPIFVAAFDIGTAYSGWAYSSISDFGDNPTKISMKQSSYAYHGGQSKEPTSLYIPDDGEVLFGVAANKAYEDEGEDRDDFMYFSTFKMALSTWDVNENTTVKAINDSSKELDVVTLFSHILLYLVTDLRKTISERFIGLSFPKDLFFIVTVPAIWTDAAKQIMRKATINAGIPTDKLALALEPECCSVYCLHIRSLKTEENGLDHLPVGTKYIVIDAGGGTIDVAVHKICEDRKIEEVYYATGGGWGGNMVDEEFKNMIISLVGSGVFLEYMQTDIIDVFDLWNRWEEKKRLFTKNRKKCILRILASLVKLFENFAVEIIDQTGQSDKFRDDINIRKDKMAISKECMEKLFAPAVKKTVDHIRKLVSFDAVRDVSLIFMAGGFSECSILTSAIQNEFPHLNVVIPDDASLCTLKGAVMYGHSLVKHENTGGSNGVVISKRVSKYTYGVETCPLFQHGKHPVEKLLITDSGDRCDKVFEKLVEKGQTIDLSNVRTLTRYTTNKFQEAILFQLFASEENDHEFIDEDGCREIGQLRIVLPNPTEDPRRKVSLMFKFGGTELSVSAIDELSGHQAQCSLNLNVVDETMKKLDPLIEYHFA